MPAPRNDERWFIMPMQSWPEESRRTVLAGKPIGANRLVAVFDTAEEAEAAVREHNTALNENGPASAPTLPDRGSNNPYQENAVNEQLDNTDDDRPATAEDYAKATFEPYGQEIVDAMPTNDHFGRNHLMMVRCAVITLTKTKAEIMEMFRSDEETVRELHDNLLTTKGYIDAMSEFCNHAALRILIAASAVDLAEQSGVTA